MRFRFARSLLRFGILSISVAAASSCASADVVDVSYAVTGSTGAWVLNFSVTNNVNPGQVVYFFGVQLPAQNVLNSPGVFVNCANTCTTTTWNPSSSDLFLDGGPNITYNNIWLAHHTTLPAGGILFGNSVSGFEVGVNTPIAPATVQWFAYAEDVTADGTSPYTGGGNFTYTSNCVGAGWVDCTQAEQENPGFGGTAFASTAAPEPASFFLVVTGFLGLALRTFQQHVSK